MVYGIAVESSMEIFNTREEAEAWLETGQNKWKCNSKTIHEIDELDVGPVVVELVVGVDWDTHEIETFTGPLAVQDADEWSWQGETPSSRQLFPEVVEY